MVHQFEATVIWGDYQHTVEVNKFGLVRFPPLKTTQLFTLSGEPNHDLELRLEQVDLAANEFVLPQNLKNILPPASTP
jgi:hypothetical protein